MSELTISRETHPNLYRLADHIGARKNKEDFLQVFLYVLQNDPSIKAAIEEAARGDTA